jgi:hypothetical protein
MDCGALEDQRVRSNGNGKSEGLEDLSYRELRLLEEVGSTPDVSQRHLSNQLGLALGVTNLLMHNLVKKGYIRSTQVAWKRWVYVLTPAGFTRKVHLTLAYVERFFDHYRRVRTLVREDLKGLAVAPDSRIAVYGTTELTELLYLALREIGISQIDFYNRGKGSTHFLGMPVRPLDSIASEDYVKVLIAYSGNLDARRQELEDMGIYPDQIATLLQTSNRFDRLTKGEIRHG